MGDTSAGRWRLRGWAAGGVVVVMTSGLCAAAGTAAALALKG